MKLSDFDFDLPDELIAVRPASPRGASRLLLAQADMISDRMFLDVVDILKPNDRLVLNNTKVLPGKLFGQRVRVSAQGQVTAKIEMTLLRPRADGHWDVMVKPLRKLQKGEVVVFADGFSAECIDKAETTAIVKFNTQDGDLQSNLVAHGTMPLPPYIASKRPADAQDNQDYQTVFAKVDGAVAAPTASLHFSPEVFDALQAKGITTTEITLHVGAGTFLPVKTDNIDDHVMHAEWGFVSKRAAEEINQTKANGGRIIPVGTTALRLIESASQDRRLAQWEGETNIFIKPGYEFQMADGLFTNFHLPKSTLMMLVSALMGKERIDQIYKHAIAEKYRFFSYGDSSLLLP